MEIPITPTQVLYIAVLILQTAVLTIRVKNQPISQLNHGTEGKAPEKCDKCLYILGGGA